MPMSRSVKSAQLQIRVTRAEKSAIQHAAKRAGMDMSTYVLSRVRPETGARFGELVAACAAPGIPRFALAELNSFLSSLSPSEFREAVAQGPEVELRPFVGNYVAAMVEHGCARLAVPVPAWTRAIEPLAEPVFGSLLESLRLHLLANSPAAFRGRNIFIDATLGAQV